MTFLYPKLLWLLLIPAFLLVWDIARVRRNARGTNGVAGNKILTATAGASTVRLITKPGLPGRSLRAIRWYLVLGLACASVALARPQWGRIEEPVFDQSREILIAVDLSRSMLADDVKPSRLDRSRLLIESLLGELKGERVGLIVFAGTSFLQAPLSSDYEILREFLPIIGPDFLPQAGTNYEAMLRTAVDSFGQGSADRFLIVLSDGEADPANPWRELAEDCKKRDIKAITLGVGTQAGAMISGEDGNFLKDERGAVVLSKLEPATLQELADITGGTYNDASQWVDIAELIKATVAKGAKGEFREASRIRLAERFQWALGPALFFLLLSLWREFPIQPRPRRMALAAARMVPVFLVMFLLMGDAFSAVTHGNGANATEGPASILSPVPENELQRQSTVDTSETAKKLSELVGRLAAQDAISSSDTVSLAEATLAYGQPLRAEGKPVPNGPVDDAIEAVSRAEKREPAAADWADLRAKLEALTQKPPSQSQQEKKEEKKDQEQQKKEQQQDQQNQGGQGSSDKDQNKDQQQQSQQSSSDQSQKSENSSDQQNKQDADQKNDSKSESSQNESGQQDKQSGSSDEGQQQQQQKEQQSDSGEKSDEQKTNPAQANNAPGKGDQSKSKDEPVRKDEKAFDSMQEKPGDQKSQSPQKQLPTPEPIVDDSQRVGGVAAEGTPLDKNVDPSLLVPLQRLERAKAGDLPGILFRRMQSDQQEKQSSSGRNW